MEVMDNAGMTHPGEILREELIEPYDLTMHGLAVSIGVPPRRIDEIVHGKRSITADVALRLGRYFGTSAQFWLNLQASYDRRLKDRGIES